MSAKKAKSAAKSKSHHKQSQPRQVPQPPRQTAQPFLYFIAAGEVYYMDGQGEGQMRVNGVHAEPVTPNKPDGINAKALGQIQVMLQMKFHSRYLKTHPNPPEITGLTILNLSPLGIFTKEEFHRNEPTGIMEPVLSQAQATPEPTLPSVPDAEVPPAQETYQTIPSGLPGEPVPSDPSEAPESGPMIEQGYKE